MVKATEFTAFELTNIPGMDTITVIFKDYDKGQGRLIVECYGRAWAAYWGGMANQTIVEFLAQCSAAYVVNRLWPANVKRLKRDELYLTKIVDLVLAEFRTRATH